MGGGAARRGAVVRQNDGPSERSMRRASPSWQPKTVLTRFFANTSSRAAEQPPAPTGLRPAPLAALNARPLRSGAYSFGA